MSINEDTLGALRRSGVRLPRHQGSQEAYARRISESLDRLDSMNVAVAVQKSAQMSGTSNVTFSLPRYFDPEASMDGQYGQSYFDMDNDESRKRITGMCRLFEATHPIIGACIDLYSRFPVADLEVTSDDRALDRFYTELFLEDLELHDHLIELGREYWCTGEAFSLGDWDADLGIWAGEEILWPDDIEVERIPLSGKDFCYLVPSDEMVELATRQYPREQFEALQEQFPDLIPYFRSRERIPVNDEVLTHVARRSNRRNARGTPILLRGIKTLLLEDRLEGAMQAVADRLYSPLLMFKIGMDKYGENEYWIPTPGQLEGFKGQLDLALSSEFRALVTHFGVSTESVFGREMMPSYSQDRNMIDERLFMVFGLSTDMLKGGSAASPYASSALRMEFVGQMLSSFQKLLKRHYDKRARTVAQAQGHYEVEKKGDMFLPVYERFLIVDENGEKTIEERPKLHWPDLRFRTMDLRDETQQREFLRNMKQIGIPVADGDLMVGVDYDFDESLRRSKEETIKKAIAESEAADIIKRAISAQGLEEPSNIDEITVVDTSDIDPPSSGGGGGGGGFPFFEESATGGGGRPNISDEYEKVAHPIIAPYAEVPAHEDV